MATLDERAWVAIAFLMLGLLLLLLEVFNPGFFIAVPGGTMFVMGAIGLIAPGLMYGEAWAWFTWPAVAVLATLGNLWVYRKWSPAGDKPLTMVGDSLPGAEGRVEAEVVPGSFSGKVNIRGSVWSARAPDGSEPIPAGARVRVVSSEGVHVVVERA